MRRPNLTLTRDREENHEERHCRAAGGSRFRVRAGQYSARRGIDHLLGGMGSGQLPSGTGQRYAKETGVKVTVETTPWSDFQTKTFREFAAKGAAYDMVVGDSQWLGAGSTQGHYVDLTDFFKKHNLEKHSAGYRAGYAEYPIGISKYWAIPLEGDANGWAYRKDWFEDPKEKTAFKAKYGYELGVPKDYKQMRDIAEFFHRPDQKRYGIAIYTDNSYDAIAMGVEQTHSSAMAANWATMPPTR